MVRAWQWPGSVALAGCPVRSTRVRVSRMLARCCSLSFHGFGSCKTLLGLTRVLNRVWKRSGVTRSSCQAQGLCRASIIKVIKSRFLMWCV